MAKKRTAPTARPVQKQPEWTKEICDDCKHSSWDTKFENKDWQGKPICLTCPFEQWKIIRGRRACAKWQPKGKEGER